MPYLPPVGSGPIILEPGQPVTVASAITAAQVLANAGSGLAATNPIFGVQPGSGSRARILNLSPRGTGAVPTTLTASLFASSDGGTTWSLYQAAFPLVASTVATDSQAINLTAGLLYQVLITSLTLGSATAASVDATLS